MASSEPKEESQSGDASDNVSLIAGVYDGLSDVETGRTKPLEQFIAEQRVWWQARNSPPEIGQSIQLPTGNGMLAVLEQWKHEDATSREAALKRRDEELCVFKENINAERERAEARKIY